MPVLRGAEKMSFAEIEQEIVRLGTKAKEGALTVEDMVNPNPNPNPNQVTLTVRGGSVEAQLAEQQRVDEQRVEREGETQRRPRQGDERGQRARRQPPPVHHERPRDVLRRSCRLDERGCRLDDRGCRLDERGCSPDAWGCSLDQMGVQPRSQGHCKGLPRACCSSSSAARCCGVAWRSSARSSSC